MFVKEVTYTDFNDVQHTEKLHFHLSSPDMTDLQFNPEVGGDLGDFIKKGIKDGGGQKLWIIFKLLIVNSYGRRSADGANFIKKPEFTEEFLNSPAFEAFFEWVLLDSPDGTHGRMFWEGILPKRMKNELEAAEAALVAGKKSFKDLSREELEQLYLNKVNQIGQATQVIDGQANS